MKKKTLLEILLAAKEITEEQAKSVAQMKKLGDPRNVEDILKEENFCVSGNISIAIEIHRSNPQPKDIAGRYFQLLRLEIAKGYTLKEVDLAAMKIPQEVIDLVPKERANSYEVMPIRKDGDVLTFAISTPKQAFVLDDLRIILGIEVDGALAPRSEILRALNRYYPN